MKKILLLIIVLKSSIFADLTIDEYVEMCKEDATEVSAVSGNTQAEPQAIAYATASAEVKLLKKLKPTRVDQETFFTKIYRKLNDGNEELTRDQVTTISTKVSGYISSKITKSEFSPNGRFNKKREPLGQAKVWAKMNCTYDAGLVEGFLKIKELLQNIK
jgi:hypothetical protein